VTVYNECGSYLHNIMPPTLSYTIRKLKIYFI